MLSTPLKRPDPEENDMPLLRTMGRTAVIAGTANRVQHRQNERWAAQEAQQQPPPAPVAAPAVAAAPGKIQALKDLAGLRDAGVLTEEEFAAEKVKVLGS